MSLASLLQALLRLSPHPTEFRLRRLCRCFIFTPIGTQTVHLALTLGSPQIQKNQRAPLEPTHRLSVVT